MTIRAALPSDEESLFALFAQTKGAELGGIPEETRESLLKMQWLSRNNTYANQPGAHNWVVLSSTNKLAANFWLAGDRLLDIRVLPELQSMGIGTQILKHLQTEHARLELHVAIDNPAQRIYRRLGFEEIGRSETDILMVWERSA